ncbi:MAG: D-aminoacyl-tRNA deacylase [Pseudomonadota bacterium]
MIALIQRVSQAGVSVGGQSIASTGHGLLALVAMQPDDTDATAAALLRKVTRYRVFSDADGKMNLSLLDTSGDLCLVPQFTLAADTSRGLRPGFSTAATPAQGKRLFDVLVAQAQQLPIRVQSGEFGADMQVSLTNDGPATFWLQETT